MKNHFKKSHQCHSSRPFSIVKQSNLSQTSATGWITVISNDFSLVTIFRWNLWEKFWNVYNNSFLLRIIRYQLPDYYNWNYTQTKWLFNFFIWKRILYNQIEQRIKSIQFKLTIFDRETWARKPKSAKLGPSSLYAV